MNKFNINVNYNNFIKYWGNLIIQIKIWVLFAISVNNHLMCVRMIWVFMMTIWVRMKVWEVEFKVILFQVLDQVNTSLKIILQGCVSK